VVKQRAAAIARWPAPWPAACPSTGPYPTDPVEFKAAVYVVRHPGAVSGNEAMVALEQQRPKAIRYAVAPMSVIGRLPAR
jgi:hypothetical protein